MTTLRTQNVYRGIPRRVEAPPKSDDNLLLDTTAMVEHIKLQRAVQQATQLQSNRKRNNGPRSKRSAFGDTNQPTHSSPSSAESDPVSQVTHQSSSWDFQQRTHQQENQLAEAGGRLSLFAPAWSSSSGFSLHPWILNILQNGYQIPLVSPPPLRLSPAYQPSPRSISNSISTSQVIDQELSTLLDRRTIEPVQSSNTPSFLSNLFIILKKDGGLHPVLNLKQLNQYLSTQHFKMETMKTITHLLQPGDFLTSIDLKDEFHHIAVHHNSRHLLRFQWHQQVYQYQVLPLGLNLSPLVFAKVLKPVLKWARRQRIRLTAYLDDLLIMGKTFQETARHTQCYR